MSVFLKDNNSVIVGTFLAFSGSISDDDQYWLETENLIHIFHMYMVQ